MHELESPATRDSQMLCLKMEETGGGGGIDSVQGMCEAHRQP